MLYEKGLFEIFDKRKDAISLLKNNEPEGGYYLAFSGGKDSVVIYDLAVKAKVKFKAHFHLSTVDPPELLKFVNRYYPSKKVRRVVPKISMWNLIIKKRMPPTRIVRYCCEYFKEHGGENSVTITGVRKAESNKRRRRELVEVVQGRKIINPIVLWSDSEVWEYIKTERLEYCNLYDKGWKRIGCVGCPMGDPGRELERFPFYKKMYIKAFQKMIDKRIEDGLKTKWRSGEDCFRWWTGRVREEPDQLCFGYGYEN